VTHPTPDGTRYPADHVLALLDSSDAGIAAKSALTEAGFAEDDIVLFDGPEALKAIQARETLFSRLEHALHRLDQDRGLGRQVYMDGLRAGRTLLMVYAPDDASVQRAQTILKAHDAQQLVALHRFSIEEL
jgi:hypothetical protein